MAFVGFLRIALKCFNVLAWPLFSLVYPLCASIRAIESNSNTDIYNLVTYWVSFSLISLFDHCFGQLLLWIPFWPYMKLLAIFWLVMPRFGGSLYVYEHFVHPCVSVTPELVMNWSSAWKEFFLSKENLLAAAERYVEENGAEALEKLIANKSKCAKPKFDVKEVKAVDVFEKKVEWPEGMEPNVARKEIKTMEVTENKEAAAANWLREPNCDIDVIKTLTVSETSAALETVEDQLREPNCDTDVIKTLKVLGTSAALETVEEQRQVNNAESNLFSREINISSREEKEKEMTTRPSFVGSEFPESLSRKVQREWTCALCQVTTQSETTLKDHLRGMRHKINVEGLNACMMATKSKITAVSSSTSKKTDQSKVSGQSTSKKTDQSKVSGQSTSKKTDQSKVSGQPTSKKTDQSKVSERSKPMNMKKTHVENQHGAIWCEKCKIWCSSAVTMVSHLTGKKHLERL